MLDKELIKKNFSRSAKDYDEHAVLQREMADRLLSLLPQIDPKKILDVGCGTGYLTEKLAEKFYWAEVIGIDIAPGMIEVAQKRKRSNLTFRIGDGEELKGESRYDLVVSNASLQWMEAPKVFAGIARLMGEGGTFVFTTFGPGTLRELRECGFRVNDFLTMEELEGQLKRYFENIFLSSQKIFQTFRSIRELARHLKELGAQTTEENKKLRFPSFRQKGEVKATFEAIYGIISP